MLHVYLDVYLDVYLHLYLQRLRSHIDTIVGSDKIPIEEHYKNMSP